MRDYTASELLEMSDWNLGPDVELGAAGSVTGVCMPQDFQAGQIIEPNRARKLAAQLLREADLHDRIWDAGFEKGIKALEEQCATMRSALQRVRNFMEPGVRPMTHRLQDYAELRQAVEMFTTDPKEG